MPICVTPAGEGVYVPPTPARAQAADRPPLKQADKSRLKALHYLNYSLAGLTVREIAEATGSAPSTVQRHLRLGEQLADALVGALNPIFGVAPYTPDRCRDLDKHGNPAPCPRCANGKLKSRDVCGYCWRVRRAIQLKLNRQLNRAEADDRLRTANRVATQATPVPAAVAEANRSKRRAPCPPAWPGNRPRFTPGERVMMMLDHLRDPDTPRAVRDELPRFLKALPA